MDNSYLKNQMSLLGFAVILHYLCWSVIDGSYSRYFFSNEGWDSEYERVMHFKDLVASTFICLLIVLITFALTRLVMKRNIVLSFKAILTRRIMVLLLNMTTSLVLSLLLVKITSWGSSFPLREAVLVYTIVSIFCSDVYIVVQYNLSLFEAKKAESSLKLRQVESEHLLAQQMILKLGLQVDNHFMFNSLGALGILIKNDPDKAYAFSQSLTTCYRYVTMSTKKELVSIEEEMSFVDTYLEMMNFRFPDSIRVQISGTSGPGFLPPMVIQGLIENALKHNSMSQENPLEITISYFEDRIVVSNVISPLKYDSYSTGVGLNLTRERFNAFNELIQVTNDGDLFSVSVPIIKINASV